MLDTEPEAEARQIFVPLANLPQPRVLCFDDNLAMTWNRGNKLGNATKLLPACINKKVLSVHQLYSVSLRRMASKLTTPSLGAKEKTQTTSSQCYRSLINSVHPERK